MGFGPLDVFAMAAGWFGMKRLQERTLSYEERHRREVEDRRRREAQEAQERELQLRLEQASREFRTTQGEEAARLYAQLRQQAFKLKIDQEGRWGELVYAHDLAAEEILQLFEENGDFQVGVSERLRLKELLRRYIADDDHVFLSEFYRVDPSEAIDDLSHFEIDLTKSRKDYINNFRSAFYDGVRAFDTRNYTGYVQMWIAEHLEPYRDENYVKPPEKQFVVDLTPFEEFMTPEEREHQRKVLVKRGLLPDDPHIPSRPQNWTIKKTSLAIAGGYGLTMALDAHPVATTLIQGAGSLAMLGLVGSKGRDELKHILKDQLKRFSPPNISIGNYVAAGAVGLTYFGLMGRHPVGMALYAGVVAASTAALFHWDKAKAKVSVFFNRNKTAETAEPNRPAGPTRPEATRTATQASATTPSPGLTKPQSPTPPTL